MVHAIFNATQWALCLGIATSIVPEEIIVSLLRSLNKTIFILDVSGLSHLPLQPHISIWRVLLINGGPSKVFCSYYLDLFP